MKKYKILIFALCFSILLNIILIAALIIHVDKPNPIGMYESNVGDNRIILNIENGEKYCIYRPHDAVIKKGKYKMDGNILHLDKKDNDIMFYSEDNIVYNLKNDGMLVFNKVDETPGYLGIDVDEE